LTIEEYRAMIQSNHFFQAMPKTMSRMFTEIHEMRDEFLLQKLGGDVAHAHHGYKVRTADAPPDLTTGALKRQKLF
jgi:hypothetical protein